jgi:hypothetical protein
MILIVDKSNAGELAHNHNVYLWDHVTIENRSLAALD